VCIIRLKLSPFFGSRSESPLETFIRERDHFARIEAIARCHSEEQRDNYPLARLKAKRDDIHTRRRLETEAETCVPR
jgi:hypothetical protein